MPEIGDILDSRFSLTKLLGEGDTAEVFAATHTQLGRQVAVKVLHSLLADLRPAIERYFQEARAASSLGHPGIVQILDAGFVPGSPYLVMELLRGESLVQKLRRDGPRLNVEQSLEITVQVLAALNATHQQGIVHRDLKPSNVFLCQGMQGAGSVKVLDFGISQLILKEALPLLTRAGALLDTARYTSPEQARGDATVDHRTDVWGAGVIFYRLLTGHLPYDGSTFNGIVAGILAGPAPAPRTYAPDVPEDLEKILARALAREPDQRYQRSADFLDDLLAFRGELSHRIATDAPLTAAFDVRSSAVPPPPSAPLQPRIPSIPAGLLDDDDDEGDEPTLLEDPSLLEEVSFEDLIETSTQEAVPASRYPGFSDRSSSQEVTMPRPSDTPGGFPPSTPPEADEESQSLSLSKTKVAPPQHGSAPPAPQGPPQSRPMSAQPIMGPPGARPLPSPPPAAPPPPRPFPSAPPGPGGDDSPSEQADLAATRVLSPSPREESSDSIDEPSTDATQVYRPPPGQAAPSPILSGGPPPPPGFGGAAGPTLQPGGQRPVYPLDLAARGSAFGQPPQANPSTPAPPGPSGKSKSKGRKIAMIFLGIFLFLGIAGGAATALLWVFVWNQEPDDTGAVALADVDASTGVAAPDAGAVTGQTDAAVIPPAVPSIAPDAAELTPPDLGDAAVIPSIDVGDGGAAQGDTGAPDLLPEDPLPEEPLPPEPIPEEPPPPEPTPEQPPTPEALPPEPTPEDPQSTSPALDEDVVENALAPLADRVRRCTRIERGYHPRELELHLNVRPGGRLRLRGITPPTPVRVTRCIGGLVRGVTLPTEGGDHIILSYTYDVR